MPFILTKQLVELMDKRILIISFAFPPLGIVGSFRPFRFFKNLPRYGWEPTVITTERIKGWRLDESLLGDLAEENRIVRVKLFDPINWYKSRKVERRISLVRNSKKSQSRSKAKSGVISWIKARMFSLLSTPDHQVFWSLAATIAGMKLLKQKKFDVILTTSPPHSVHIPGIVLSRLFNVPWIADFRDPWVSNFMYKMHKTSFQIRIERRLERATVQKATKIISTSDTYSKDFRDAYATQYGDKFVTVTNCFDKELFKHITGEASMKFRICHLGMLYHDLKPYEFFIGLSRWLEENPEMRDKIELVIVNEPDHITVGVLRDFGLHSVTRITGYLPYQQALRIAKGADVLLLMMGTSHRTPKGWLPSKLFDYIGTGKPILAIAREGEAAQLVRKTKRGIVITRDDIQEIVKALNLLYKNRAEKKFPSDYTEDELSIELQTTMKSLVDILNGLSIAVKT